MILFVFIHIDHFIIAVFAEFASYFFMSVGLMLRDRDRYRPGEGAKKDTLSGCAQEQTRGLWLFGHKWRGGSAAVLYEKKRCGARRLMVYLSRDRPVGADKREKRAG